jgi:putative membrane protein
MLRYVVFIMIVLVVFMVAVVFAAINPAPMTLDLAFAELEVQTSLALVSFLAAGWLFGLLCAGFLLLKFLGERRQLRKALQLAESEVSSLRSMPLQDAD